MDNNVINAIVFNMFNQQGADFTSLAEMVQIFLENEQNLIYSISLSVQIIQQHIALLLDEMKPAYKSNLFWEVDCDLMSGMDFKENFRVTRETFAKLCRTLKHMHRNSKFSNLKTVRFKKRLAIGLYTMGSPGDYRSTGKKFSVSIGTVHRVFMEFCSEVWKRLSPTYLSLFPLTKETVESQIKWRFRRIGKDAGFFECVENANIAVKAACVLHNFLIEQKDEYHESWIIHQELDNSDMPQPPT